MKESGFFKRFLKVLWKIYAAISVVITTFIIFLILSPWLAPSLCGSHNLGNNLYFMEGDPGCGDIVYCTSKEGRRCIVGLVVIGKFDDENGVVYSATVDDAKSNREWIIVDANQGEDKCYFLIDKSFNLEGLSWNKDNCDSIVKSHTRRFEDKEDFYSELDNLGIKMRFDD